MTLIKKNQEKINNSKLHRATFTAGGLVPLSQPQQARPACDYPNLIRGKINLNQNWNDLMELYTRNFI